MILSLFSVLGFNAEAKESPRFSNDTEEHWYYLCFSNTGKVIQNNGNGKHMTSEQPDAANQAQKWKLVGTQTDFMLERLQRRHISYIDRCKQSNILATGGIKPR